MKKDNINLILAGIGVLVALIMLPKGDAKDGSESGGFQLPTIFPTGAGTGTGEAPGGGNTYNISFPDFPGFPSDGTTKKDIAMQTVSVLERNSSGGFSTVQQSVPSYPGVNSGATLAQGIANVSPAMMTPVFTNPAAVKKSSSSGSGQTYAQLNPSKNVTVTQPVTKKTVVVPQKSFNLKYIGKR